MICRGSPQNLAMLILRKSIEFWDEIPKTAVGKTDKKLIRKQYWGAADRGVKIRMIIDDILDTGRTLAFATDLMTARGAEAVHTCVLLDKHEKREVDIEANYVGFPVDDLFVVGYGIDMAHLFRSLPFIGVVRQD